MMLAASVIKMAGFHSEVEDVEKSISQFTASFHWICRVFVLK